MTPDQQRALDERDMDFIQQLKRSEPFKELFLRRVGERRTRAHDAALDPLRCSSERDQFLREMLTYDEVLNLLATDEAVLRGKVNTPTP